MKKIILLMSLCTLTLNLNAQKKGGITVNLAGQTDFMLKNDEMNMVPIKAVGSLGYYFLDKMSLNFIIEPTIVLINQNDIRDYNISGTFGLGLLYNCYSTKISDLDISFSCGSTISGEWEHLYVDGGIRWLPKDPGKTKFVLGAGLRYHNFYNKYENFLSLNITIGVRVNNK